MQERLQKETKKLQVAEQRRRLDLEGYGSDLSAMKKKINFYQKYIGKLRRLVEEDQGEMFEGIEEEDEIDENSKTHNE